MANPLVRLIEFGQSFWLDNIRRGFTRSGELKKLIDDDGLRGVTSNPTIFEKAVAESQDYEEGLKQLVKSGVVEPKKVFDKLTTDDIREACDVFAELYRASGGGDGYVSIELPPYMAKDTKTSVEEGLRLRKVIDRPNVFIKVPATDEGVPAVRQLIAAGINVNITLMFGQGYYERVIDAYFAGLEDRLQRGEPIDTIASVASCFVSRVDTETDKRLENAMASADEPKRKRLEALTGKIAIANSKRLYQVYLRSLQTERWKKLAAAGAKRQRPLWASTSTKNPKYPDTYYVEALIGPDTVDTMPPATIAAFRDHGKVARTLDQGLDEAEAQLAELEALGISLKDVTDKLLADGLVLFENSYDQLLDVIREKVEGLRYEKVDRRCLNGFDQAAHYKELERLDKERFVPRVWAHDPAAWNETGPAADVVKNRLGWLEVPERMESCLEELTQFADDVRHEGFKHAVLMGMGGSSLCSIVMRSAFGVRSGFPELHVLDSTVPEGILSLERRIDLKKTLFIEASKSGTTLESRCFGDYFFEKVTAAHGSAEKAAGQFAYITDPGTPLAALGKQRGVRRTFLNPPDIGGRYSALSFFGLVPAVVAGYDIAGLLRRATLMAEACAAGVKAVQHPAVSLGVALAQTALAKKRDKITLLTSSRIASLGLWLEQLIAESTGKDGKGLIPVAEEPLGDPGAYGNDRLFVHLQLQGDESFNGRQEALEKAGHPLVQIVLRDELDLGEEFFCWEFAVATAGALLGINPFDEPNVKESKDNTHRILASAPDGKAAQSVSPSDESALAATLKSVNSGDYIAIAAFIAQTPERHEALQRIRATLRDATHAATTLGYGPRFLHSTGQLHKGGPNTGVFLQLVGGDAQTIPIPGQAFDFATLKNAQAMGDLESLRNHGRRVTRIDLGADIDAGLAALKKTITTIATQLPVAAK